MSAANGFGSDVLRTVLALHGDTLEERKMNRTCTFLAKETSGIRHFGFFLLMIMPASAMGQVSSDALVGYWRFDEALNDWSCQGLDLQAVGGPTFTTGLFGSSLDLSGSGSDYATRLTDDAVLDFGVSDFTIQVWVRFDSTGGEMVLAEKMTGDGTPPGTQGWTITKIPSNTIRFGAATTVLDSPAQTFPTGVWHHIVVRRTATGRSPGLTGHHR
jgi:hypothetical protein